MRKQPKNHSWACEVGARVLEANRLLMEDPTINPLLIEALREAAAILQYGRCRQRHPIINHEFVVAKIVPRNGSKV